MRYKAFAVFVALNVSLMAGSSYAADENAGANTQENAPIGRVTAAFGTATITGPDGKHPGDVDTLFKNQERIATDGGGVTLLLASRVVIKVDARSALMIAEGVGQTIVNLEYGTAHVYVGRRPITSGMVCVQDPCVRAETDSGVFLVSYDPDRKEGYYACEHDKLNLHTINGPEHKIALTGDTQATLINGKLDVCCLDRVAFDDRVKSLDRLGESNDQQGSQTFRLRSRTIDMQQAISQLSASGWITGSALPNQLAPLAATAKTDKHGKSTVTTDSPKSTSTDTPGLTISSNTTLNVSPANGSPAVSSPPAASDTNAPRQHRQPAAQATCLPLLHRRSTSTRFPPPRWRSPSRLSLSRLSLNHRSTRPPSWSQHRSPFPRSMSHPRSCRRPRFHSRQLFPSQRRPPIYRSSQTRRLPESSRRAMLHRPDNKFCRFQSTRL